MAKLEKGPRRDSEEYRKLEALGGRMLTSGGRLVASYSDTHKTSHPMNSESFEEKVRHFFLQGKSKSESIQLAVSHYPKLHAEYLERVNKDKKLDSLSKAFEKGK